MKCVADVDGVHPLNFLHKKVDNAEKHWEDHQMLIPHFPYVDYHLLISRKIYLNIVCKS